MQHAGVGAAGVGDLAQPGSESVDGEPVGLGLGGEPLQERQADGRVQGGEELHGAGEHDLQVGTELVGGRDTVLDQVPAGTYRGSQRLRGWTRAGQGSQAPSVGADHVGQHVGVEPVVLVPRRAVARAQVLDLYGCDDQHRQSGGQQCVDDGTVGAFDTDLVHAGLEQPSDQAPQSGCGVGDAESIDGLAVGIDDAHDVVVLGPVDACADSRSRLDRGDTHTRVLAVAAVGSHPVVPGPRSRSLTDRRSLAHSPVAGLGVLGHRTPQNSYRTSTAVEQPWRWSGGDQGCISRPSVPANARKVVQ